MTTRNSRTKSTNSVTNRFGQTFSLTAGAHPLTVSLNLADALVPEVAQTSLVSDDTIGPKILQ
jgi:hypothetical protein